VETRQEVVQNETIVVAEDAAPIRKMVCAMLAQSGYRCLEAGDGREALDLIQAAPNAIDLLLTDVIMPNMGGIDLARRVARIEPNVRIVFMSGYSDDPIVRSIERSPGIFLAKPFTASALLDKVRETLEAPWYGLPEANSGAGAR
jgi:two-component system, cell cycle sensor histidine kinase and response regulator CckA